MPSTPNKSGASKEKDILAVGKSLLQQEADALRALASYIDDSFSKAIDILSNTSGRVVVAGIGKSGHVARKISATLASTGTPALFVHPSEASHGDLGMITTQDSMVLLSKSGESTELADLVEISKRFTIPLIAICVDSNSTLARAASVRLGLPDIPEACPMGLAPTTSSTMMMALGDALAIALLERRGFSADNFHALHPGGKLGKSLMRVSDLMHGGDALPIVSPDTPMSDVLIVMSAKNFGCAGVVASDNSLVGVITDGDLRRHMTRDLLGQPAHAVMSKNPKTIEASAIAAQAIAEMVGSITNLFVVENRQLVGILRLHDCLRAGIV